MVKLKQDGFVTVPTYFKVLYSLYISKRILYCMYKIFMGPLGSYKLSYTDDDLLKLVSAATFPEEKKCWIPFYEHVLQLYADLQDPLSYKEVIAMVALSEKLFFSERKEILTTLVTTTQSIVDRVRSNVEELCKLKLEHIYQFPSEEHDERNGMRRYIRVTPHGHLIREEIPVQPLPQMNNCDEHVMMADELMFQLSNNDVDNNRTEKISDFLTQLGLEYQLIDLYSNAEHHLYKIVFKQLPANLNTQLPSYESDTGDRSEPIASLAGMEGSSDVQPQIPTLLQTFDTIRSGLYTECHIQTTVNTIVLTRPVDQISAPLSNTTVHLQDSLDTQPFQQYPLKLVSPICSTSSTKLSTQVSPLPRLLRLAILDTGVDPHHALLGYNVAKAISVVTFVNQIVATTITSATILYTIRNVAQGTVIDTHGHGTKVASLVAARNVGVIQSPHDKISIYSCKSAICIDNNGKTGSTLSALMTCVNYCRQEGVDMINISADMLQLDHCTMDLNTFAATMQAPLPSQLLIEFFQTLNSFSAVTFALGNNNFKLRSCPLSHIVGPLANIVPIAAYSRLSPTQLASFSNYIYDMTRVVARGEEVSTYTIVPTNMNAHLRQPIVDSGTSFAAPFVAAHIALWRIQHPHDPVQNFITLRACENIDIMLGTKNCSIFQRLSE